MQVRKQQLELVDPSLEEISRLDSDVMDVIDLIRPLDDAPVY